MPTDGKELPSPILPKKNLRDVLFLAEQASESGVKALPGRSWGLHYPQNGAKRTARLEELLKGKVKPKDVAEEIKPDALIYDVTELEKKDGYQTVSAKIHQASANIAYYDYERFAQLVSSMKGLDVDIPSIQRIYDGVAQSRIAKEIFDRSLSTGKQQMETALRAEAATVMDSFKSQGGMEKILNALKLNWLCDDMRFIRTDQRDKTISQLTREERALYDILRDSYRKYVQDGEQSDYESLVGNIRNTIPKMKYEPPVEEVAQEQDEMSESMQELEKELNQYKDKVGPPGTPGDPGIPPNDSDEYHTPPPSAAKGEETSTARPFFEIKPAGSSKSVLIGDYCSGRKSYYDIATKTWSKKKRVNSYSAAFAGEERQNISGTVTKGITSIPIPNNYALDNASLRITTGTKPKISRDQNGCFYIESDNACTFSIDFLAEKPHFQSNPIPEDTQSIYQGTLSSDTESLLKSLTGSPLEKADQARQYILSHHFYPGGGDLQSAQALQYKLRQSPANQYIQNLDSSEYLECYSANTLFIAMMRKAGIPARLVIGHKIQSASGGKAVIDSSTGHAWTEVWDGIAWRRFDSTPRPKPEDKKKEQDQKPVDNTPTQKAQDGGVEQPPAPPQKDQGEKSKGQKSQSGQQQMGEASDSDLSEAQSNLDQTEKQIEQLEQKKDQLDKKLDDADTFKDLEDMREQLDQEELLDDQKDDLQKKLDAKEQEMQTEMKEELEQMREDGFIEDEEANKLEEELESGQKEKLDELKRKIDEENKLYNEYQDIKDEVIPLVDKWFKYFAERLPHQLEVEDDVDTLTRQGAFNRRAPMRPRNLIFNLVKNPRVIRPNIKPLFVSSTVLDVSGSMSGDKLKMARKYLVFKNELFSKIGKEFGYIRWADYIFSDGVSEIKTYEQEYDSPKRYKYQDGSTATVKARLINNPRAYARGFKRVQAKLVQNPLCLDSQCIFGLLAH